MIRVERTPSQLCFYLGRLEIRKHNIGNSWRDWRQFLPQFGKWWLWVYIPFLFNGKEYGDQYGWIQCWKGIGIGIGDRK